MAETIVLDENPNIASKQALGVLRDHNIELSLGETRSPVEVAIAFGIVAYAGSEVESLDLAASDPPKI